VCLTIPQIDKNEKWYQDRHRGAIGFAGSSPVMGHDYLGAERLGIGGPNNKLPGQQVQGLRRLTRLESKGFIWK
jgi:hypothetical protein